MRSFHSARLGQTCLFFAALLAAAAPLAAFTVDNRTPYDIRVRVPQASEAGWDNDDGEEVEAESRARCDWTNVDCSSATEDDEVRRQLPLSATVLIEGSFGDMSEGKGLFTCTLPLLADGVLVVDVQERGYLNGAAGPYAPTLSARRTSAKTLRILGSRRHVSIPLSATCFGVRWFVPTST